MHDKTKRYVLNLLDILGLAIFLNGVVFGDIESPYAITSVIVGWSIIFVVQYLMVRTKIFSWKQSLIKIPESGIAFIVASTSHWIAGNYFVSIWLAGTGAILLILGIVVARFFKD